MATPSDFILPILQSIETIVLSIKEEYPLLKDKDVEWCYDQLKNYFRKKSFNQEAKEPLTGSNARQDLMDEILNILDWREEEALDVHLLNDAAYTNGGFPFANSNQVYVVCFNSLIKSVRLWRKDKTKPSYLHFIKEHVQ